jgi:hypothetical protein
MDVIDELEAKLDRLDQERRKLEEELELKRFQLDKVESIIERTEALQREREHDDEET